MLFRSLSTIAPWKSSHRSSRMATSTKWQRSRCALTLESNALAVAANQPMGVSPMPSTLTPMEGICRRQRAAANVVKLGSPLPVNSDQQRHYREQTQTEFTGRGAGGEGTNWLPNRLRYSFTHTKPIPQNLIPWYSQHSVAKICQKLITSSSCLFRSIALPLTQRR